VPYHNGADLLFVRLRASEPESRRAPRILTSHVSTGQAFLPSIQRNSMGPRLTEAGLLYARQTSARLRLQDSPFGASLIISASQRGHSVIISRRQEALSAGSPLRAVIAHFPGHGILRPNKGRPRPDCQRASEGGV